MMDLNRLNRFRDTSAEVIEHMGGIGDHGNGVFHIKSPSDNRRMMCIASDGLGWDHVSVSLKNRCPTWREMEHVKHLFFKPDEVAIQLHVRAEDHININKFCLHIWRPQHAKIPLPPGLLV